MIDFTYTSYKAYIEAIRYNNIPFYKFNEFFATSITPEKFCLIRHDIDRWPKRALKLARLEYELGIKSTYFFRIKSNTFKPKIIKSIYDLGHEIGYHYESLSDTNGDISKAIIDFKENLEKFRTIVPINTCSMHGRPLKLHDSREIWRIKENHEYLINELKILGEVYLDIYYSDIAYINDTGRNWTSGKSNIRDSVNSQIKLEITSGKELLEYFKNKPHNKICFQIHPERWANNIHNWFISFICDMIVNCLKKLIKLRKIK